MSVSTCARRSAGGGRLAPLICTLVLCSACMSWPGPAPTDPSADFVAHPGYRGLVVDRMNSGQQAVLVRAPSAPSSAGPDYVLEVDGQPIAALWVADHNHVTVRGRPDATAPLVGEVLASWEHGAIRLTFRSAGGSVVYTSPFDRIDSQNSPTTLDRELLSVSQDLPGIYRAELRNAQNARVGWLRVRILPYQGLPRDYDGVVPGPINGPLAAGAVALVDSEIDSIIQRNAFPEDRIPEGLAP